MDNLLERLETEQRELTIKINAIENFFHREEFLELSFANQNLLKEQVLAMHKYNDILRIRLELLSKA